jgi:hypothetical protein
MPLLTELEFVPGWAAINMALLAELSLLSSPYPSARLPATPCPHPQSQSWVNEGRPGLEDAIPLGEGDMCSELKPGVGAEPGAEAGQFKRK